MLASCLLVELFECCSVAAADGLENSAFLLKTKNPSLSRSVPSLTSWLRRAKAHGYVSADGRCSKTAVEPSNTTNPLAVR